MLSNENPFYSENIQSYFIGFEEDEKLRSSFIRELTIHQIDHPITLNLDEQTLSSLIPKKLIHYWHDQKNIPKDVKVCLDSWGRLRDEGFEISMFNDETAATYIADRFGANECSAFALCKHPAMRCDYLRMCVLLLEGGLYVDADDVLLGDKWKYIFRDGLLKVQPLCYDIQSNSMVSSSDIWCEKLSTDNRIFYVNNDPIAAPAGHPILQIALSHATEKLLNQDHIPEIQSTTGPGNLTAALAAHANNLIIQRIPLDFEFLRNWETIAETRWDLSYRNDERNWRNIYLA